MILNALFILFLSAVSVMADTQAYWVLLKPTGGGTAPNLSEKAQLRLAKRSADNVPGGQSVSQQHLAALRLEGYQIRYASRFLNAVSVDIFDNDELEQLLELPFVESITPVKRFRRDSRVSSLDVNLLPKVSGQDYGLSQTQNQMLNIPLIHDYGYDASGILIGVFDTGFNTDHPVFDNMNIVDQHDFVDHHIDASGPGQDHGINVLSILGGYDPGKLIGPAYSASFLLARTEDVGSESTTEEDNWVAALEWADALGVDIITTSLNYRDFDNPNDNYPPSAIDGETAIITRAANVAAERGILVVNSAGNEGPDASTIWPPSDSRHVLSVGSIDAQYNISTFSGRGPTYDGRTKPDVVARGSSVYMATGLSSYKYGNGTSYAAPQIAGLAALLLQANPELNPDSMIQIFHMSASLYPSPDNDYGYGLPDVSSYFPKNLTPAGQSCMVYPNPGKAGEFKMVLNNPVAHLIDEATIYNILGKTLTTVHLDHENSHVVKLNFTPSQPIANQLLIISFHVGGKRYSGKFVYLK